jgi:hypothetical protein
MFKKIISLVSVWAIAMVVGYVLQKEVSVEAATQTDVSVSASSYLGGVGEDQVTAVEILSDKSIVVSGKFFSLPTPQNEYTFLAADSSSPGAILKLSPDGQSLLAVARLGNVVDDVDINRNTDQISAIGDFGLVQLNSGLDSVMWQASESGIDQPTNSNYSNGRRVAVGLDGTVSAVANEQIFTYQSDGTLIGTISNFFEDATAGIYNERFEDVAVDSNNQEVLIVGWGQMGCDVQQPYILKYDYTTNTKVDKSYNWWCTALTDSSINLLADTRLKRLNLGQDGNFYIAGSLDGGNTVFTENSKYLASDATRTGYTQTTVDNPDIDTWTNGAGAGVGEYGYYAQIDGNLEVDTGQFIYSNDGVNEARSFKLTNVTATSSGEVHITGQADYDGPYRGSLSVDGTDLPTRTIRGENYVSAVNSSFSERTLATSVSQSDDSSVSRAIATRDGMRVVVGTTQGSLYTKNALDDTLNSDTDTFISVSGDTSTSDLQEGDLLITELNWAGTSASSADEWVEIYNPTNSDIDVSSLGNDLQLINGGTSGNPDLSLSSCSNSVIPSKGYWLMSNYNATDSNSLLNVEPDCVDATLNLDNSGELLQLKYGATVVDEVDGS